MRLQARHCWQFEKEFDTWLWLAAFIDTDNLDWGTFILSKDPFTKELAKLTYLFITRLWWVALRSVFVRWTLWWARSWLLDTLETVWAHLVRQSTAKATWIFLYLRIDHRNVETLAKRLIACIDLDRGAPCQHSQQVSQQVQNDLFESLLDSADDF